MSVPRAIRRSCFRAPRERVSTRVLVVGGGGREHALAWGLARYRVVPVVQQSSVVRVRVAANIIGADDFGIADRAEGVGLELGIGVYPILRRLNSRLELRVLGKQEQKVRST